MNSASEKGKRGKKSKEKDDSAPASKKSGYFCHRRSYYDKVSELFHAKH